MTTLEPVAAIGRFTGCGKTEQKKDIYGMRPGHRPGYHKIPKIEDLLERHRPEVLVVQMGNCFHDFFPSRAAKENGRAVDQHYLSERALRDVPQYLRAFRKVVLEHGRSVKRAFWITPPSTGTITKELGDQLESMFRRELGGFEIFDSRLVTSWPYRAMDLDGIHFWGNEANAWGDEVHSYLISRLAPEEPVGEVVKAPEEVHEVTVVATSIEEEERDKVIKAEPVEDDRLRLTLRLSQRSNWIPKAKLFPYRNEMAVYEYEVIRGDLESKKIRVLHPIYLNMKPSGASRLVEGSVIKGIFSPVDPKSPWMTWPRANDLPLDFTSEVYICESDMREIRRRGMR